LSAALGRLLADDELRRRLARRARATYEERFSAGRFAAALGTVYKTMIDALTNTARLTDRSTAVSAVSAVSLGQHDETHAGAARDSEPITVGAART